MKTAIHNEQLVDECCHHRASFHSLYSRPSHYRAAHLTRPGALGKVAREPPLPPERFLVHFGCDQIFTVLLVLFTPATMTHLPIAAHAQPTRACYIGGNGSHRSMSPSRVSTSHDAMEL
jgi:hypothetical protein